MEDTPYDSNNYLGVFKSIGPFSHDPFEGFSVHFHGRFRISLRAVNLATASASSLKCESCTTSVYRCLLGMPE